MGGGSDTGIPACEINSRSRAVTSPAILTNKLSHLASAAGLVRGEAKHRSLKLHATVFLMVADECGERRGKARDVIVAAPIQPAPRSVQLQQTSPRTNKDRYQKMRRIGSPRRAALSVSCDTSGCSGLVADPLGTPEAIGNYGCP